jgi:hypothetical protein
MGFSQEGEKWMVAKDGTVAAVPVGMGVVPLDRVGPLCRTMQSSTCSSGSSQHLDLRECWADDLMDQLHGVSPGVEGDCQEVQ